LRDQYQRQGLLVQDQDQDPDRDSNTRVSTTETRVILENYITAATYK